jgi:hypothetical protein
MQVLRAVPLMLFPAVVYALFALPSGIDGIRAALDTPAFTLATVSGAMFEVERGHLLTLFAIVCLFFEIVKSSVPTTSALIENSLAVLLFAALLTLFLLVPAFATAEFFLIMTMCALDFMAGAVVMVFTSRRTVAYE